MSSPTTIPTAQAPDVCTMAILVDGTDVSGHLQVMSVAIARELNRIPVATIHLKDGEAAKGTFAVSDTDAFAPGAEIEIQLGYRAENETVFKGVVARHAIKVRKTGGSLVVECRDRAAAMTLGRKSATFLDTTDADVMEELVENYGLTADVQATAVQHGAIVQFDSTDWDFLICRGEANGMVVTVADGAVSIKKPEVAADAAVAIIYGSSLLELDAEIDGRIQSPGLTARTWSAADQEPADAEAEEPGIPEAGNLAAEDLAAAYATEPELASHGGALSTPELQAWADARLVKQRLSRIRGRAAFQGFPGLAPGGIVAIEGVGERFAGNHFVAGVRHSVVGGNWQTDVQFGLDPELFAETYPVNSLPAGGLLPAAGGLQLGTVTALEGDPESEDRIQVRLPLVSGGDEGIWMRLATLDAGVERGTFFRPEIDDEVVVGFINGDPRHAVVLGQVHSSAHATPEPAADANHLKGYVSREKLKLTFDDEAKAIRVETPAGNSITLSEQDGGIAAEDENGNTYAMAADGVSVRSSGDIALQADGDVAIEGMNITIKARQGLTAESIGTAEFSGASTSVKGSAQVAIEGGVVRIN